VIFATYAIGERRRGNHAEAAELMERSMTISRWGIWIFVIVVLALSLLSGLSVIWAA
jgi:hypothetical protein